MIGIVLVAALMSAPPTKAPEASAFCRGVLFKDQPGSFLLITLKIAGDAESRAKVRRAAEPLGAYFFESEEEGRTILQVGFTSNIAVAAVDRLWKSVSEGVYGRVTVEPFALPGSWINPDDPCFGSSVRR